MEQMENFNEYMESFKQLPLSEKQAIIMKQLKVLASFTNSLCNEIGVNNDLLINKELLDVEDNEYSEDDFVEAILVLINSIQNSVCDFHIKFADILSNKLN